MFGIAVVLFIASFLLWIFASLIINTMNNNVTMRIQTMNEELLLLKNQNQTLTYEIQSLENRDRIYAAATAADLDQLSDNIISIGD